MNGTENYLRDEKVYECLQRLPENYRDVLYLTYYRGFSADEVKRAIGKSKKQVYNLLARSKAALKQILVKEGITHEHSEPTAKNLNLNIKRFLRSALSASVEMTYHNSALSASVEMTYHNSALSASVEMT